MKIIVLCGVDFCGKGTQIDLLKGEFPEATFLREPGGTPAGEGIRKVFLDAKTGEGLDNITRTLLLFAARKRLVIEKILPIIQPSEKFGKKPPIIMDRFFPSTFAYQWASMKRREDRELVEYLTRVTVPQEVLAWIQVFQLSIPYDVYLHRLGQREEKNHMDYWNKISFHRIQRSFPTPVHLGFLNPSQFSVLDGTQTPEEIHEQVMEAISNPYKYSLENTSNLLHKT